MIPELDQEARRNTSPLVEGPDSRGLRFRGAGFKVAD